MVAYQGGESLGGDEVRLSSAFAAELPVVVNFWAPLCGPCRTEMPAFQRVADEFAGRVVFLGVDISPYWPGFGNRDDALALIRESGVRYPLTYAVQSPLEAYSLRALPSTYFFTPDGTVAGRLTGAITEQQLRAAVGNLVGGVLANELRGDGLSSPGDSGYLLERLAVETAPRRPCEATKPACAGWEVTRPQPPQGGFVARTPVRPGAPGRFNRQQPAITADHSGPSATRHAAR